MFITILNEHRQPAAIRAAYIWRIEQDRKSKMTYIRCIHTDIYTITEESYEAVFKKWNEALIWEKSFQIGMNMRKGGMTGE